MGKARGPKRKQAPVRKRPPVKNNGALLAKQGWVQNGTKGTSMGGLEGEMSVDVVSGAAIEILCLYLEMSRSQARCHRRANP